MNAIKQKFGYYASLLGTFTITLLFYCLLDKSKGLLIITAFAALVSAIAYQARTRMPEYDLEYPIWYKYPKWIAFLCVVLACLLFLQCARE